ncbi:hypothetical protein H0H87_002460 [Tephrocybe sp. NHM501043]|nr:hypothetical protein H0H87_002460 [Tephrocybe sp. NHM501043]
MIATLGYLAIHQDDQEKAYAEVKSRIGRNDQLDLLETSELPYLQAFFQEAARLFSTPLVLARTLTEDFPLKLERPSPCTVVLPKGSRILIDMVNTFRNPNIYTDPSQYEPSRWLGVPETEVAMFGTGPRACIGRKFASTEAINVLALFMKDSILDIHLAPGESRM